MVARNLTEIVDIILVSDHGMKNTSVAEPIYLEDILGDEGMSKVEHQDGKTSRQIVIQ